MTTISISSPGGKEAMAVPNGNEVVFADSKDTLFQIKNKKGHNPQLDAVLAGIGYGRSHLGQKKVPNGTLLSI